MAAQSRTVDELRAAKRAMIDAMPGWSHAAAYALGVWSGAGGDVDFRVTNHVHDLPGVVLARVLGYRTGSRSYVIDLATFDRAIAELEPAGACNAYDHPNLWAWQRLRAEIAAGDVADDTEIVVAFVGDETDDPGDGPVRQLRRELGIDR